MNKRKFEVAERAYQRAIKKSEKNAAITEKQLARIEKQRQLDRELVERKERILEEIALGKRGKGGAPIKRSND